MWIIGIGAWVYAFHVSDFYIRSIHKKGTNIFLRHTKVENSCMQLTRHYVGHTWTAMISTWLFYFSLKIGESSYIHMVARSKCICEYISKAVIVGFSLVTTMLPYSLCS